ncbi:MAG: ATP-binding protein [Deltaproteobacteria bacterium]|nr:ATP-binding protein [Deltaproteobacteria bacterium]RKX58781.1 MAG: ATP-binding protein [Thermodesulfobacteriota bacterium]
METILEELIADFHERSLPALTRRHVELPWLPNKIDTVIGMRRSGKTWLLFQIISDLLSSEIPKESILYLNLEDERLLPMTASDLRQIPDIYYRRYPHLRDRSCTFFFDEIQNIPGWEQFIRRLLDTENIHICLTGSSAKLLSREIATSLRGRSIATEIFPFSFLEALEHAGIDTGGGKRPGAKKRALLENRLVAYLLEGGFPEVQKIDAEYRVRILQDYLDVVILRDLVERHQISNIFPLRYMIRHLLNATASLFSVNKFYNDLKSQGIRCGKNTLHEYLGYLSDTYLFFQVYVHTHSERVRMVNPRKIYAIDPGLVRACSRSIRTDWGHLLENFVFLELRRSSAVIEYYRTKKGREVDFLVTGRGGQKSLVQVSADMKEPVTRQRELRSLLEAMKECKLRQATVVTLNQEEKLETEAGLIHILPASLWALKLFESPRLR